MKDVLLKKLYERQNMKSDKKIIYRISVRCLSFLGNGPDYKEIGFVDDKELSNYIKEIVDGFGSQIYTIEEIELLNKDYFIDAKNRIEKCK